MGARISDVRLLDEIEEEVPWEQLDFYMSAGAYLRMLCGHGVNKVEMTLQKPTISPLCGNVYDTFEMAEYIQKKADQLGAKFDRSRGAFHYEELRQFTLSLVGESSIQVPAP